MQLVSYVSDMAPSEVIISLLVTLTTWYAGYLIYNVYFHPLAGFPGPKLAGASRWYEAYFDLLVGDGGQYMWEVRRMHQKYGPIVRIGPNEVHVNDPKFREVLYAMGAKRDKVPYMTHIFGVDEAAFATQEHALHKMRRNAMAPFFSKRSVTKLEGVIKAKVLKMSDALNAARLKEQTVTLRNALMATAIDVVTEYSFGKAACANTLDEPDFAPEWSEMLISYTEMVPLAKQFPGIAAMGQALPMAVTRVLNPLLAKSAEYVMMMHGHVVETISKPPTAETTSKDPDVSGVPTVFHEIMQSKLPDHEKSPERLTKEAMTLVAAASETSSTVLTSIIYHVAEDRAMQDRLKSELGAIMPSPQDVADWRELEKLSFLTALIKEGLRWSSPVSSRNPYVTDEPLSYHEWTMPAGTYIGMTLTDALHHPEIFPEPTKFDPDRWSTADAEQQRDMQMAFVPFGKGSRDCLGSNLAWAEMYHIIAAIFRRFEVKAVDTKPEDILFSRDNFMAKPPRGAKNATIKLVKEEGR